MAIILQVIGKPVTKIVDPEKEKTEGKTKVGKVISKVASIFEKKPKSVNTPRYQKKGGSVSAKIKSKSKKK